MKKLQGTSSGKLGGCGLNYHVCRRQNWCSSDSEGRYIVVVQNLRIIAPLVKLFVVNILSESLQQSCGHHDLLSFCRIVSHTFTIFWSMFSVKGWPKHLSSSTDCHPFFKHLYQSHICVWHKVRSPMLVWAFCKFQRLSCQLWSIV